MVHVDLVLTEYENQWLLTRCRYCHHHFVKHEQLGSHMGDDLIGSQWLSFSLSIYI